MVRRLEVDDELARRVASVMKRLRNLEARPTPRGWIEIDDQELSSPAAAITFSSITDRYRHLMLVGMVRSVRSTALDTLVVRINGDTGLNYDWMLTYGRHETTTGQPVFSSISQVNQNGAQALYVCANNAPGSMYSPVRILIPSYRNTSINKTYEARGGMHLGVSQEGVYVTMGSGAWKSTNVITQLDFSMIDDFAAHTRMTLYGLG